MSDVWHDDLERIAKQLGCEVIVGVCACDEDLVIFLVSPKAMDPEIPALGPIDVDTLSPPVRIAYQAIIVGTAVGDGPTELLIELGERACYVRLQGAFGVAVLLPANSPARKSMRRTLRRCIDKIAATDYAQVHAIENVLSQLADNGMVVRVGDEPEQGDPHDTRTEA